MAQRDGAVTDQEEPGALGLVERVVTGAEGGGGPGDGADGARVVGRRDQQEGAGVVGQPPVPVEERPLHPGGEGQPVGQ